MTRFLPIALLTLAYTSAYYARTALSPLQETVGAALALTDNEMAMLQGPALGLAMAAGIPLGALVDRLSRTRLLMGLSVILLVGSVMTAQAQGFGSLFTARLLTGLAVNGISIAVISLLADLYLPAQRGRATMVVALGAIGGMSAAFALGGALLATEGWRHAMLLLSAPLLALVIAMPMLREPARTGVSKAKQSVPEICAALWQYRSTIGPLSVGFIMVGIADGAALVWAAPTLSRHFGLGPERVGAIMAGVLLFAGVLGPIAGGSVADLGQRAGGPHRTVIALTILLALTIPAGLFAAAPGVISTTALLALFLTLGAAFNVATQALATIIVPNELRGVCVAFLLATSGLLAFGVAPVLVSGLAGFMGGAASIGAALAVVCAVAGVAGVVVFAFCARSFADTKRIEDV